MLQVTTIGLDIAKNVFHAHGADERGAMVFSRKLTRAKLLDFFAGQPSSVVALEACGGAHHWARELQAMGHDVRLIPPAYVKPFVKRNKNDAVDAEAICEAAQRPGMRFVAVKSEEQQAAGLVFRTRDLVVRQRTQLINAIRGHLAEYGWVAPRGTANMTLLASLIDEEEMASTLPEAALPMFKLMVDLLAELNDRIATLDRRQAKAWQHLENGRANDQAAADHWRQLNGASGVSLRSACRFLAGANAGAQAADARLGRTRQQDGAHGLGAAHQRRRLQSSGSGRGVSRGSGLRRRGRRRSKEGMAQRSARRGWKNQGTAER